MRYARDDRSRQVVDAHVIGERARFRALSCPSCGARVFYKSSIGQSPDPIFAHYSHQASPDCENYYPWQGIYQVPSLPAQAAARRKPAVEDTPDEFGLGLEDADAWTVYLRVPEITPSELGSVPLRSLTSAFVEIESGSGRNRLPLIDLRPGVGFARLAVSPSTAGYKVVTTGSWPSSLGQRRWQAGSRGLSPRGTLFRRRHGEWTRLRDGSPVQLGEELRVVADEEHPPPQDCVPIAAQAVSCKGQIWRMWRLSLPETETGQFARWLESLEIGAIEPTWEVRFASVPEGVLADGQTPVFSSGRPLVARLRAPNRGARADVSLSNGSTRLSESVATPAGSDTVFVQFSVAWPGTNELKAGYDDRSALPFETRETEGLSKIKAALARVPQLEISIGEIVIRAWNQPVEIVVPRRTEELPAIGMRPALDDVRVNMWWEGAGGNGAEEGASPEIAMRRLTALLEMRQRTYVRIDGGGLGRISLVLRAAAKRTTAVLPGVIRKLRWIGTGNNQEHGTGAPLSAWPLRRLAALDRGLLGVSRNRDSRLSPLFVRTVREIEPR